MTALTCEEVADLAAELALEALPGDQRALALEHLAGCPACRDMVEQLAETADALLSAHASVQAPLGFEQRTLAAMRLRSRPPRSRVLPLTAAAATVVAVVALAALAAGSVGLLHYRNGGDATAEASGQKQLRTVPLVSTSGVSVGDVSAYTGKPVWVFMRLSHGSGTGTFRCLLDVDGGRTVSLGTMSVSAGRGGWGENVSIDVQHIARARLVSPTGETVATATFH